LFLEDLYILVSCGASPVGTVRQEDERNIARGARRIEELVCIFIMARAEGLA